MTTSDRSAPDPSIASAIRRFSSRRQKLDASFLSARLSGARAYDRIAGYFNSSLLEVAGEALEGVTGKIRVVCNSDLDPRDVETAKAAQLGLRRAWCASAPESLLSGAGEMAARTRFQRLYSLLKSGKLEVRVLPDTAFGLVHGKAGTITLADGRRTAFMGSANESKSAWRLNYEIVWEDASPEAIAWVQEEFDALWSSPFAVPLAEAVVEDIARLAERKVLPHVGDWTQTSTGERPLDPAPAIIEAPVYRKDAGLWAHQKYFVKTVLDAHRGPTGKARFVLADQVGLGKTLQLAMAAQLMGLIGDKPILVICPKTLLTQWQGELRDLLDMPSALWNGRQWVDENEIEYPAIGPEGIKKCPRRVGIASSGLISRGSDAAEFLKSLSYDCIVVDEAHRARRKNLGEGRDDQAPDPNKLLRFLYEIAPRTRSLLLATATPVQLRPVEAFDLLDVLSRGDASALGNDFSRWRNRVSESLSLVMGRIPIPVDETERWEWARNPFPPRPEHRDFEILRRSLDLEDAALVADGALIARLGRADRQRLENMFSRLVRDHNPYIRRIIRRTRKQLEEQIDAETGEPLLKRIAIELLGESDDEAITLPPYLREAYVHAESFCAMLKQRLKGSGFLKTLLLRRVGSTIEAGLKTARKMLEDWESIEAEEPEEGDGEAEQQSGQPDLSAGDASRTRSLTPAERTELQRFVDALEANRDRDPKYEVVVDCLRLRRWLDDGCIVFSQYYDSIRWLADQLTVEFPDVPIGVYSGATRSGIIRSGEWTPAPRDELKKLVMRGDIRLLLGTDAASEGLNLQRLARLINLDLPWNPTRLEQRKGRIQRIGQIHDTVMIYNMRYRDSVEDRVHQLLSDRLRDINDLFGQIPDVLEDAWVAVALGEIEQAKKIIDALPKSHPFQLRYTKVENVDWESCRLVLDAAEKRRVLKQGW